MSVPEWLKKWETAESTTISERVPKEKVFESLQTSPDSITVVDLRNEQERGYITKAVHIPATDINGPDDIKAKVLDPILRGKPQTKQITIHCNSSAKRASYVAGWLDDYLKEHPQGVKVDILHEGIVGWLGKGSEFESETTWVRGDE